MTADDPGRALGDLLKGDGRATNLFVKICGITRPQDAELAVGLGADARGIRVLAGQPSTHRPATAKAIAASVPAGVLKVGVFVDEDGRRDRASHGRGRARRGAAARA